MLAIAERRFRECARIARFKCGDRELDDISERTRGALSVQLLQDRRVCRLFAAIRKDGEQLWRVGWPLPRSA